MVDPAIAAVGGVAVAGGLAFAYAYLTGNDTDVSADLDGDGEAEASYTIEGNEDAPFDGVGGEQEVTVEEGEEAFEAGVDLAADALEDVKGVGPARAETLQENGFDTPEDLYYAADSTLTDISGFGDRFVEMVREDIGGVDNVTDDDEQ
jgi:predicted flap endonuclease-1-like 5' DNA nuclease